MNGIITANRFALGIRFIDFSIDDDEGGKVFGVSSGRITITLLISKTINVCNKSAVGSK